MKKIMIKKGVNLVLMPTTQFKTLNIAVDFCAPIDVTDLSSRALLTYVTAVSSQKYPTQQAVAKKTIELYGAQFQTDVIRFGQTHHVRYNLQLPAPTYVANSENNNLMSMAFQFMEDMIFDPLILDEHFDTAVFNQERQSLINEITSINEDKKRYALSKLRAITYENRALQLPALGSVEYAKKITSSGLLKTYTNMINNDNINIVVFGDISGNEVEELVKRWPLTNRDSTVETPFYRQKKRTQFEHVVEKQSDINQAVLTLSYQLSLEPNDPRRFTAIVFNALYGGSPLSKLFMNVREKASLAYSIYSRWQHDTGMLSVIAGLSVDDVERADKMIQEELKKIQLGQFDQSTLSAIKTSIINDYLSQQDSPSSEMSLAFLRILTQRTISIQEWVNAVENVSIEDVADLAKEVTLQAKFTLIPETSK